MKVCVTEKPSVARDIARLLGANDRHDGYFEGNGYQVTWTFGHLCELKEPNDYTDQWKWWSLGQLPMIPQRFGIKLKDDEGIKKQFNVIKGLIAGAEEVINCGDAGQEGELIQRWVYQKAECARPVKRLWISSLTDESIRKGFEQLKDAKDFDNLYFAGLSRAIGDWILGMNATRLYTLKYSRSRDVLSVGRVQTPTLAMIVARQREIDNFVPENYWELKTKYRGVTFNSTRGRFKTEGEAVDIVEQIRQLPLTVTSVETKKGREAPPRLFDLTSLQVECNKKFGMSADEALKTIQSLYEKKATTYPRVDTTYLSDDIYPQVPGILKAMVPYANLTAPVLALNKLPKSKKVFDNSKVTDHHAIIPTNVNPATVPMTPDEKRVYHLVAMRFIAAFYPDCEFNTTTVMAQVGEYGFKATGKEILKPGWRDLFNKPGEKNVEDDKEKADDEDNGLMPHFEKGESGPHEPSVLKRTTQPPKPYTEGTLLRAMETAGKTVDDEELRDAMKENGIGRPSTRAAIIETLFKRRYIRKERKSITPTLAGIQLIDTIHEPLLKSASLTGLWEKKLREIERGEFSAAQFIEELKIMIGEIVLNVLRDNNSGSIAVEQGKPVKPKAPKGADGEEKPKKKRSPRLKSIEEIPCPVCGKGHLVKGKTAYGCSEYNNGCHTILPFTEYPADLTSAKLSGMVKKNFKAKQN
ncbi:MAG: DNA topoisomerase 3 [Muribaculaceae bacterium]|nr:DNA topoisomerase 3 [Muribaculaceae bacterium]